MDLKVFGIIAATVFTGTLVAAVSMGTHSLEAVVLAVGTGVVCAVVTFGWVWWETR